jgi:hypothetical protein
MCLCDATYIMYCAEAKKLIDTDMAKRVHAANLMMASPQFALEHAKTVGEIIYQDIIGSAFERMTDDVFFIPANPHLIEVTNS